MDDEALVGIVLMHPVSSTAISYAGYNHEGNMMFLQFPNSPTNATVYFDVPVDVWHDFMKAESKGRYYNTYIRELYKTETVEMRRKVSDA